MPTHGSMTKAGKVRKQTPKIPAKERKNPPPRLRNRFKYLKKLEQPAQAAPARRR
ncbi:MAG: 30S ribosomal protein S30e [Desulfurococcales archaeon]|nr:30S ribosomal protein S30e [Desulfurococcales archaeon]